MSKYCIIHGYWTSDSETCLLCPTPPGLLPVSEPGKFTPITHDTIHPTEEGYQKVAEIIGGPALSDEEEKIIESQAESWAEDHAEMIRNVHEYNTGEGLVKGYAAGVIAERTRSATQLKEATERIRELEEIMKKIVVYLDEHHFENRKPVYLNSIAATSIFHKMMKESLNKTK